MMRGTWLTVGIVVMGAAGSMGGCSCGSSTRVASEPSDAAAEGSAAVEDSPSGQAAADAAPDSGPLDSSAPANDASPPADAGDAAMSSDGGADAALSDATVACTLPDGGTGTLCSGSCTSLASDPSNCGACGATCEAGALCSSTGCQNVVGSLSGLRWNLPCTMPSTNGINCPSTVDGSLEEVVTTTVSGSSGVTYQVTLHFRGIVEQKTYYDFDAGGAIPGEPDSDAGNPGFFISGGTPDNSTWNIYELQISDPPQTYYLNSGVDGINYVWLVDYLATIPMSAGATVTLTANTVEGVETSNQGPDGGPVYVPGVPPYPAAFSGQFVQMDIVSVTPSP